MTDTEYDNMWLQRLYEILNWLYETNGICYDTANSDFDDGHPRDVMGHILQNFPMGDDDPFELAELRDVLMGYKREPLDPPTCKGCFHLRFAEGPVCKITGDLARISCKRYLPGGEVLNSGE